MSDRAHQIDAFLAGAGWQDADRHPLAGDMSTRRYSRLVRSGDTAVLMDAENPMHPFVTMTDWLRGAGFSTPEIFAADAAAGLLLLEDFGDCSVNALIADKPGLTPEVHEACIDLLLALRAATPPNLTSPDANTLVEWTLFTDQHYPGANAAGLADFRDCLRGVLEKVLPAPTLSLRDFHADNLMWLPEREGSNRFGLLDYQDAFLTHPAYDLASFLTDARVDVPRNLRETALLTYLDRSGDDEAAFCEAFAALSAQRNLRILGIFAHGAANGRAHHLDKLPRVHGYFAEALEHPVFGQVRQSTLSALPDPQSVIEALT